MGFPGSQLARKSSSRMIADHTAADALCAWLCVRGAARRRRIILWPVRSSRGAWGLVGGCFVSSFFLLSSFLNIFVYEFRARNRSERRENM